MNIVVAMKQIPDLRERHQHRTSTGWSQQPGHDEKKRPEAAVLLKEKEGGQVIVLSGGKKSGRDSQRGTGSRG